MSNDTRSRLMTTETIHTCSYYCERPGCIRAQRDELRVKLEALTAAQRPIGDGCHCGTCTCNPNMTPAVRFDLSPAQTEGAIREHLIRLGWTPPDEHAQSQPAEGEEIMVNTPYDVFILPLQPSGLSSGPRFVVHVPGPEAQATMEQGGVEAAPPIAPVGVDWPIIVEGLRLADRFFDGDDRYWKPASTVRAAYLAALAAQQQGGAE